MKLIAAKVKQAIGLLNELDIDAWLIVSRESNLMADPAMSMVVGHEVTWESFFVYTRSGRAMALVGNLDVDNFKRAEWFTDVATYTEGVGENLRDLLAECDPKTLAVNYSVDDPAADGLTHGMYLALRDHLYSTPYADNLVSAENIVTKLRARKLPDEIDLIRTAVEKANLAWQIVLPQLQVGQTEREIAALITHALSDLGVEPSFPTIVNAGDKTSPGHGVPTDARISAGDLLHVDFGARYQGYCSDLQRLVYFQPSHLSAPPDELSQAFDCVNSIITATAAACKPGKKGKDIDQIARTMLGDEGYPEYQHALGHQLGRAVHDGGALLGPKWPRYGKSPLILLEENNIFTLELEIALPGIGCVGLEEDVRITADRAEFLGPRQTELVVK
ncbi:MAG: Xaa-Pro peptidase family protein [bacterium]